jgi:hypothetical protein
MRLGKRAATASAVAMACVATVVVVTAPPAQALRPSTASLRDGDGRANGCVVTVSIVKTTLPGSPELGPGIFADAVVACPRRADVHRIGFSQNFVEVRGDGSSRTIGHGRTGGTSQTGPPIAIPVSSGQFTPCANPDNDGRHTYFVRARVSAKEGSTFRDRHPYVGKVAVTATVTC